MRDACRLAAQLGLAHVEFDGNGEHYACYPDGTAQRFSDSANGRDWWNGSAWVHVNAVAPSAAATPPAPPESARKDGEK